MADFYTENLFKRMNGGRSHDEDYYDEDEVYDEDEDSDVSEEDFFAGGANDKNQFSFTVEKAFTGTYEGGRFISKDANGAAKKASTAIFRHLDIELGIAKNRKVATTTVNAIPVAINTDLIRKHGKQPINNVSFILERTDREKPKKYYSYTATRIKLDDPAVVKRAVKKSDDDAPVGKGKGKKDVVTITFNYKVKIETNELPEEYMAKNLEFRKKAAKKRADKRRAENPDDYPVTERKTRKPRAAAKKVKATSVEEIIKALTSPVKQTRKTKVAAEDKAPRKTKVAAEGKAPRKTKVAAEDKAPRKTKVAAEGEGKAPRKALTKKTTGGGFCSFF